MKITNKHKNTRIKIIAVVALLVIGAASAYELHLAQTANSSTSHVADQTPRPQNTVDYNPPSPADQQQQQDTKTDVIAKDTQPSPSQPDTTTSVTIARANQGAAGLPLNVRTIITNIGSGTCTATLTKTGQPTVTKTFPVGAQGTYTTCAQADIAASEFSVSGDWALAISVTGDGHTATTTGSVTITK